MGDSLINTIIPFGAVIACWLTRKKYVIHVHENMFQDKELYKFLRKIYVWCNSQSIFVSRYLQKQSVGCRNGVVIPNALNDEYCERAMTFLSSDSIDKRKTILMISSLRKFKGVYEFVKLAKAFPKYPFELVLSADDDEIMNFKQEIGNIYNLKLYGRQTDVYSFYQRARVLLQLSRSKECVETFGMTILEAMVYGVPAIVPDVGGPTELVKNGVNGFTVSPYDINKIKNRIKDFMEDDELYEAFSKSAVLKSKLYKEDLMINNIEKYII